MVYFPLSELLNSQYCIGTALTIVNREAVEHTKVLAQASTAIIKFWRRHHNFHDMFYDGRPATRDGPSERDIGNCDSALDVLLVRIAMSQSHQNYVIGGGTDIHHHQEQRLYHEDEERESLQQATWAIAIHIAQWYHETIERRYYGTSVWIPQLAYIACDDYDDTVPRNVVRVTQATAYAPCRMMVRAGVLRDYLQHHSLWTGLSKAKSCPLAKSVFMSAWVATTLNILTYGNQVGSASMRIHRSAAAYFLYAFPQKKIDWDQVPPSLKTFLQMNGA
jgi:hypothetical protein